MTWPDELAEALGEEPLEADETADLLDIARDVAHGTERRNAPLSTYLLGLAVGRGEGNRPERLAALVEQTRHLLGVEDE
ncbi:MAG: DUF6457 domain-containing protein [Nitriliruptorales bacterium]|nr:DUF6457 domain-containing protein [Nitriliruptorales bacterium]